MALFLQRVRQKGETMAFDKRLTLAGLIVASAFAGCSRDEPEAPPAQAQSATTSPAGQPTTVTGCLRAGDAENTFVLTTAQTVDGTPAATYHLSGSAGVNLQDHIGKRIEVSGVIDQQARVATREPAQPADDKATGTAGTPTVQTGTQLSLERLDVTSVKRADGDCEL
jgi:hypothetical protein